MGRSGTSSGKGVRARLRVEARDAFLRLDPIERVLAMERRLYELIALKASMEGVSEGEIYQRYLARRSKGRRRVQA